MARRPAVLAPLAVLALPFRVPIQAGSSTSNLLVPLYLVVALGALAWIGTALAPRWIGAPAPMQPTAEVPRAGGRAPERAIPWVQRLLALYVVLYGSRPPTRRTSSRRCRTWSSSTCRSRCSTALLRELDWDAPMIRRCLTGDGGLAIVFSLIGFYEYATKTIILNPKLDVGQRGLHTYFTVNSVFFDPTSSGATWRW